MVHIFIAISILKAVSLASLVVCSSLASLSSVNFPVWMLYAALPIHGYAGMKAEFRVIFMQSTRSSRPDWRRGTWQVSTVVPIRRVRLFRVCQPVSVDVLTQDNEHTCLQFYCLQLLQKRSKRILPSAS